MNYACKVCIANGGYCKQMFHTFKFMCASACNNWKYQWQEAQYFIYGSHCMYGPVSKKRVSPGSRLDQRQYFWSISKYLNSCKSSCRSWFMSHLQWCCVSSILQSHLDATFSIARPWLRLKCTSWKKPVGTSPSFISIKQHLHSLLQLIYW